MNASIPADLPHSLARRLPLRPLFIAIVLLGSFLLFLIQPLFARLVLPVLGGSPSVWNTAMLFYQAALLVGYAYAHALQRLPFRAQAAVHIAIFAVAAFTLPIGIRSLGGADTGDAAAVWLLQLLAVSIGPVFVAVAAQAPLMQAWFARSPDKAAANPYFLYAASNIGSLAGLLTYPFLLEPFTSLPFQQAFWSAGFLLLLGLIAVGALAIRSGGDRPPASVLETVGGRAARPVGWGRRLHWLALAAVPSGLMLSTTTHITTDIMAMPLLWVLPLAAYLISFILAFSPASETHRRIAVFLAPIALLVAGGAGFLSLGTAATLYGLGSILLLLVVATALHCTLAADRPPAASLTEYYLWMAAGGVVGGLFPAIIAPQIFDWTYEHPILLLLAALLIPAKPLTRGIGALWTGRGPMSRALRILTPPLTLALGWWLGASFIAVDTPPLQLTGVALMAGIAVVAIGRPLIFTWHLAMLMLALGGWQQIDISTIENARQRSFFGIYTVENSNSQQTRRLLHGTTLHGVQSFDSELSGRPMSYYAPLSAVGQTLTAAPALFGPQARIGIVGLGTGTLLCYAKAGQSWTVFEIDPLMVTLATDPKIFTYVRDCKPDARIVVGDARLKLADEPAAGFDVLAVDAFSSDAIPLHLLTREAFEIYLRSVASDGFVLLHISNRFLDLEPVVAALAKEMGLSARLVAFQPTARDIADGYSYNSSIWIALARDEARMQQLVAATADPESWRALQADRDIAGWTDSFASILPVLKVLR